MKPSPPPPRKRTWVETLMVWLAIALGTGAGCTAGFKWSASQAHTLGTVVLEGDHRGMIVLGHAMLAGFACALVFGLVAEYLLKRRRRKKSEAGQ